MTSLRSALLLALVGLLSAGFFWATDPTIGVAPMIMDPAINRIDAANQAWPGTIVGFAGSALIVVTGLYVLLRRAA
jgi:hypothetical protein